MEARFRAQGKAVGELVVGDAHALRNEPIERIRLVSRAGHQRVEGAGHAGGAVPAQHEDVEGVERIEVLVAERLLDLDRQRAALRGGGTHVIEMLEVGRIFQLAEARQAVRFGLALLREADARQNGQGGRCRPGLEDGAAIEGRHRGAPVLAALASSNHQIVGKAAPP